MTATAIALDHVGVCNRDLAPMTSAYEALGFTLTPIAQQSGRRTPTSEVERFATGNRCAFLQHGYIELLSGTIQKMAETTHVEYEPPAGSEES